MVEKEIHLFGACCLTDQMRRGVQCHSHVCGVKLEQLLKRHQQAFCCILGVIATLVLPCIRHRVITVPEAFLFLCRLGYSLVARILPSSFDPTWNSSARTMP